MSTDKLGNVTNLADHRRRKHRPSMAMSPESASDRLRAELFRKPIPSDEVSLIAAAQARDLSWEMRRAFRPNPEDPVSNSEHGKHLIRVSEVWDSYVAAIASAWVKAGCPRSSTP